MATAHKTGGMAAGAIAIIIVMDIIMAVVTFGIFWAMGLGVVFAAIAAAVVSGLVTMVGIARYQAMQKEAAAAAATAQPAPVEPASAKRMTNGSGEIHTEAPAAEEDAPSPDVRP